ncbi:GDP-mannose pyrophosphatase NudK [Hymenobacter oligotrophus]|uniref:GDP-mannose pyrophosphatase n=1 Tax=Hymenobacter oligotrophus TaxID=2319843 RepID=A0A3B7QZP7_9BACT|nr:GDP-mannose pyrophosphatase NudK [Hymenobacter oligotrophus]AYA38708.1 GDP-mannose pyrophosphatase NudK [Hymenobacter oligotrophus]
MFKPEVRIQQTELLSDDWYTLHKYTFALQQADGEWCHQSREVYDRGNGAVILLYHPERHTVVLTRQFRLPTYLNGNPTGMLIEAPAGLLDDDHPEDCVRREAEEETGYRVHHVQKVFEAYMSPGSVTEIVYFFVAEYLDDHRMHAGGGVVHEQENIEVLELPFAEALRLMHAGEIKDAKTIMLLQYAQLHGLVQP